MSTPTKPWQQGGASTNNSPIKRIPLKGLFADGIWKCNCDPRLPAAFFEVKKDGPNKGRWFYTCQLPKDDGCGLFLWKDDAVSREMRAVIENTRSEHNGTPTKPAMLEKRDDDDDEYGEWSLSPEEGQRLIQAIERTASGSPAPETPRKAIKTSIVATPGSKRKREEGALPTPSTGTSQGGSSYASAKEDIFTTPSTRLQGGMWDGNERFHIPSPSATPTPSRFRESTAASETSTVTNLNPYDISAEVLSLLQDQHIDEETTTSLKQLLNKHAMKISGIAKGRDITRIALKAKDAKIAELQQKISMLEGQREMDKTVIRHFKSDMTESVERRRRSGRGRGRGHG